MSTVVDCSKRIHDESFCYGLVKQEKLKKTISMSPELIEELERRRHEWGLRSKGEVLERLLGWMLEEPEDS